MNEPRAEPGIDPLMAIAMLFRRCLQRDQSERVGFACHQASGAEWAVAVFLGETPPKIADHYKRSPGARDTSAAHIVECGPSPLLAFDKIKQHLEQELRLRVVADQGVLQMATGRAEPIPPPPVPANPHADDPERCCDERAGALPTVSSPAPSSAS